MIVLSCSVQANEKEAKVLQIITTSCQKNYYQNVNYTQL